MLGGKIHRATVTGSCLDYEGSVTIDSALLDAAGILENEAVEVWNVTTGARLTTYALAGEPRSGEVCLNGSAAHHASTGDLVILATFVEVDAGEATRWRPSVVFVDEANRIRSRRAERPDCAMEARG
jgi:aspartate 1-decarboxylase